MGEKVALAKKWHTQNRLQVYSSRLRVSQALELVLSLAELRDIGMSALVSNQTSMELHYASDYLYSHLQSSRLIPHSEGHTKVLSGTKKERIQWVFFVVKGVTGQRYYKSITIGRDSGSRTKMGELIILNWIVMRYARYGE